MDAAFNLEGYTTEVTVPEELPAAGMTVKALEDLGEEEIEVITLTARRQPPLRARRQCDASSPATFSFCRASRRRSNASSRWRSSS